MCGGWRVVWVCAVGAVAMLASMHHSVHCHLFFVHDALESQFQLFEQGVSSVFVDASHWVTVGACFQAIGAALSKDKVSQADVVRQTGHVQPAFISARDACFFQ